MIASMFSKTTAILELPSSIMHILVDIHGVLTDGQERKRFLEFMATKYHMNFDQHNSLWSSHISALDINEISAADYLTVINDAFNTNLSVKSYYQLVAKNIHVNQELLDKLSILNQQHQVCIVSDNLRELRVHLNSIFGMSFSNYKQFYSYEFGKTKANGMFLSFLQQLNAKPSECLFIDDSLKNVEVANSIGIKALHFTTNEQLFTDLKIMSKNS